uniref:Uncharacterized protein n=1 Tax=Pararge aegeria TaxID=116150 RepID=S4P1G8_9NEOP
MLRCLYHILGCVFFTLQMSNVPLGAFTISTNRCSVCAEQQLCFNKQTHNFAFIILIWIINKSYKHYFDALKS